MTTVTKRLVLGMAAAAQSSLLSSAQVNGFAIGIGELEFTADEKWTVFHALDLCHGLVPTPSFPCLPPSTGNLPDRSYQG